MLTAEEARRCRRGKIDLHFCQACGFIFNAAFEPTALDHTPQYEEILGFPQTLGRFDETLAADLVKRFNLYGKEVIEIGCGNGTFLNLLCRYGHNRGWGFDPAYSESADCGETDDRIIFIQDHFSNRYRNFDAHFVCCKMTLEHIADVRAFLTAARKLARPSGDTVYFFLVPEISKILGRFSFWEIHYPHCSYFNSGSLSRLFANCGYAVLDTWTDYEDRYLMITATPAKAASRLETVQASDVRSLHERTAAFPVGAAKSVAHWTRKICNLAEQGKRIVLWGAGAKTVSFLTALGLSKELDYVVDLNPHRDGKYIPATGHQIFGPRQLLHRKPDYVVATNSVFQDEIAMTLGAMELRPQIMIL